MDFEVYVRLSVYEMWENPTFLTFSQQFKQNLFRSWKSTVSFPTGKRRLVQQRGFYFTHVNILNELDGPFVNIFVVHVYIFVVFHSMCHVGHSIQFLVEVEKMQNIVK